MRQLIIQTISTLFMRFFFLLLNIHSNSQMESFKCDNVFVVKEISMKHLLNAYHLREVPGTIHFQWQVCSFTHLNVLNRTNFFHVFCYNMKNCLLSSLATSSMLLFSLAFAWLQNATRIFSCLCSSNFLRKAVKLIE